MQSSIDISVVMPVYNGGDFLRESIESILNQSFDNFELIIVDDGSSDNSNDIIESYLDKRIVHLRNYSNRGVVFSLNKGLTHSKGDFIARMDCDDISNLDRLRIQYDYLVSHPDVALCGSWFRILNNKHVVRTPVNDCDVRICALTSNPFAHPTVMLRKSVLSQNNLKYNELLLHVEDYGLWLEILELGKCVNIPQILLEYRIHSSQVSSRQYTMQIENFHKLRRQYFRRYFSNTLNSDIVEIHNNSTIAEVSTYYKQLRNLKSIFSNQRDLLHLEVVEKEIKIYMNLFFRYKKFRKFRFFLAVISNHPPLLMLNFRIAVAFVRGSLRMR